MLPMRLLLPLSSKYTAWQQREPASNKVEDRAVAEAAICTMPQQVQTLAQAWEHLYRACMPQNNYCKK